MRAFLFASIALAAAVSAAQLEQRSPLHAISTLVARADYVDPDIIPSQCQSACSDTVADMNSCTSVSCICTNQNGQQLKRCVDCLVEVADSDTATENGQMTLDAFVDGCDAAGEPVNSLTVGGSSPSNSNSNSNSNSGPLNNSAAPHLVVSGGVLTGALVGFVAYLF